MGRRGAKDEVDSGPSEDNGNRQASWATNLSVRAFAVCLSVWMFTSCVFLLRVPFFYAMMEEPELRLQDQFFTWRSLLKRTPETANIILVTIDDESIRRLGSYPPWPRVVYSFLIDRLRNAGASVIGLDFVLDCGEAFETGASSRLTPRLSDFIHTQIDLNWEPGRREDDKNLVQALRASNLVLPAIKSDFLPSGHVLKELFADGISELGSTGDITLEPDFDGIIRRTTLVSEQDGQPKSSFALRLAEKSWNSSALLTDRSRVLARGKEFPVTMTINFAGPEGTFPTIPFWRLLEELPRGLVPPSTSDSSVLQFKDKIVLIGFQRSAGETTDWTMFGGASSYSLRTPLSSPKSRMSGLELQANILSNLLTNHYLNEPSPSELVLILLLCSFLFAYLYRVYHGRPWMMLGGVVAFIFTWVLWSFLSFVYLNYLVPCGIVILGIALPSLMLVLIDQNLLVFHERKKHTRLFHSMTSKAVASEIDRQKLSALGLEGKAATVTTLVCEIPGLAALSGVLPPETFIRLVDETLAQMTASVHSLHGVVWRVDGSGLTAVWGAPLEMEPARQALLAMDCAWRVKDDLRAHFDKLLATNKIPVDPFSSLRIALNTGQGVCGKLSQEVEAYAIVGQAVDFPAVYAKASRSLGAEFLAGEGAAMLVAEHFELRELDESRLEELYRGHKVYEVLGAKGGVSGVREEAANQYANALAAYREGSIEKARDLLVSALRMFPEDRPSILLLERCQALVERAREQNKMVASSVDDD